MGEQKIIPEVRSKSFLFRMTESEITGLQQEAGKHNMNVSQFIRYKIFDREGRRYNSENTDKTDKKNISKAVVSSRDSVKKSCTEIEKFVGLYSDSLAYAKEKGELKNSDTYTSRIVKALVHNVNNMLDSFNQVSVLLGGKAIEKERVDLGAIGERNEGIVIEGFSLSLASQAFLTKLKFMWKSSLVGDVVNVFPEKEIRPNVKTVSFILQVEENLNGQKGKYLFLIESHKQTFALSGAGKGAHVTVYGTTAIRQKGDGKFDLYLFADSIVA